MHNTQIRRMVIVSETFAPEVNGVANTLRFLVKELEAIGIEVLVVRPRQYSDEKAPDNHLLVKGFPIPFYSELKFGVVRKNTLCKALQRFKPDIVYIATEGPLGYTAMKVCRSLSVCAVSGFHTNFHLFFDYYHFSWLKPLAAAYLRLFHNATAATFTPTDEMQRQLSRMGINNAQKMSRGIDTALFTPDARSAELRQKWGLNESDICVIYVGRIAAEKNINLAIAAFKAIQAKHPSSKFVLVGKGPLYETLSCQYPEFIFCGEQTGRSLTEHYASGDLFLFPSVTDTFGNVVLEAMASGLSVLAFDYAAPGALISDGLNGHTVAFANESEYVEKASNLGSYPNQIMNTRQAARKKSEKLSWLSITTTFLNDLQCILKEYQYGDCSETKQRAKI